MQDPVNRDKYDEILSRRRESEEPHGYLVEGKLSVGLEDHIGASNGKRQESFNSQCEYVLPCFGSKC